MKNILVVMLRYIGDVVLATPVLRSLRDRFPSARLSMVVNGGTEDVLKRNPDVDEVLIIPRNGICPQLQFLQRVRAHRFDCVVDLTDGDRSAVLAWVTGAPVRVGFNEENYWRGLMYTSVVKSNVAGMHRVERNLETLRALGLEPKSSSLVLETAHEDEAGAARVLEQTSIGKTSMDSQQRLVMLQPAARYWFKAWSPERFAQLADLLAERENCKVLVGGSEEDGALVQEIQRRARSKPTPLAGRTTLTEFAAVLKRCALFVGNDNGPMHMAAALGTPVVALFGPSDPSVWGPRGDKTVVLYKGLDCDPCFHPGCKRGDQSCMNLISVEEVYQAARPWLV